MADRDDIIEEIKRKVREAARTRRKAVMLHYQVLIHAKELEGMRPVLFCQKVGEQPSWATEFNKMMNLAKLMEGLGVEIKRKQ